MKKILLIAAGLAVVGAASADVIAGWTFETSLPTTGGPLAAEIGSGSAVASHPGGSTYSSPAGNGSAHSWSSNTWVVGDYYEFDSSATGFAALTFTWDQTSSNTGPRDFALFASVNGGAYSSLVTYTVLANASPNPVWNATTASALYTNSVTLTPAFDNAASVSFRLVDMSTVSANGGTVASGGTDRVDNVSLTGTAAVPEPASLAVVALGLLGVAARRRRK